MSEGRECYKTGQYLQKDDGDQQVLWCELCCFMTLRVPSDPDVAKLLQITDPRRRNHRPCRFPLLLLRYGWYGLLYGKTFAGGGCQNARDRGYWITK
jgi:hypothetical protein